MMESWNIGRMEGWEKKKTGDRRQKEKNRTKTEI
jgi:hypothetical protein